MKKIYVDKPDMFVDEDAPPVKQAPVVEEEVVKEGGEDWFQPRENLKKLGGYYKKAGKIAQSALSGAVPFLEDISAHAGAAVDVGTDALFGLKEGEGGYSYWDHKKQNDAMIAANAEARAEELGSLDTTARVGGFVAGAIATGGATAGVRTAALGTKVGSKVVGKGAELLAKQPKLVGKGAKLIGKYLPPDVLAAEAGYMTANSLAGMSDEEYAKTSVGKLFAEEAKYTAIGFGAGGILGTAARGAVSRAARITGKADKAFIRNSLSRFFSHSNESLENYLRKHFKKTGKDGKVMLSKHGVEEIDYKAAKKFIEDAGLSKQGVQDLPAVEMRKALQARVDDLQSGPRELYENIDDALRSLGADTKMVLSDIGVNDARRRMLKLRDTVTWGSKDPDLLRLMDDFDNIGQVDNPLKEIYKLRANAIHNVKASPNRDTFIAQMDELLEQGRGKMVNKAKTAGYTSKTASGESLEYLSPTRARKLDEFETLLKGTDEEIASSPWAKTLKDANKKSEVELKSIRKQMKAKDIDEETMLSLRQQERAHLGHITTRSEKLRNPRRVLEIEAAKLRAQRKFIKLGAEETTEQIGKTTNKYNLGGVADKQSEIDRLKELDEVFLQKIAMNPTESVSTGIAIMEALKSVGDRHGGEFLGASVFLGYGIGNSLGEVVGGDTLIWGVASTAAITASFAAMNRRLRLQAMGLGRSVPDHIHRKAMGRAQVWQNFADHIDHPQMRDLARRTVQAASYDRITPDAVVSVVDSASAQSEMLIKPMPLKTSALLSEGAGKTREGVAAILGGPEEFGGDKALAKEYQEALNLTGQDKIEAMRSFIQKFKNKFPQLTEEGPTVDGIIVDQEDRQAIAAKTMKGRSLDIPYFRRKAVIDSFMQHGDLSRFEEEIEGAVRKKKENKPKNNYIY